MEKEESDAEREISQQGEGENSAQGEQEHSASGEEHFFDLQQTEMAERKFSHELSGEKLDGEDETALNNSDAPVEQISTISEKYKYELEPVSLAVHPNVAD